MLAEGSIVELDAELQCYNSVSQENVRLRPRAEQAGRLSESSDVIKPGWTGYPATALQDVLRSGRIKLSTQLVCIKNTSTYHWNDPDASQLIVRPAIEQSRLPAVKSIHEVWFFMMDTISTSVNRLQTERQG